MNDGKDGECNGGRKTCGKGPVFFCPLRLSVQHMRKREEKRGEEKEKEKKENNINGTRKMRSRVEG